MKLLVLGATGGIGIEVVRQALEHHHMVTAFVRAPERLRPFAGRITVVQGNLLDHHELARVTVGQDAVLSAFGPRVPVGKGEAHLLRDFGNALIDAMRQAQVRRGLVVSTAFLFKDAVIPPAHLLGKLFFGGVMTDAEEMEAILRASGLDVTIVRPPRLIDKAHTGRYRVSEGHLPLGGFSIARADVADFMLHTVENGDYRHAVVGLCA
jgi:putative NADH-flavin reductase